MLTIRQAVHEPTRRVGTPLFTGESNLPRQPGIWEPERLNRHRLEGFLCDEARYIIGRGGRKVGADGHDSRRRKVDPMACVKCQSPCGYGLRYLTLLTPEERKEYRCGGDCAECPQPCNLYRAMRAKA